MQSLQFSQVSLNALADVAYEGRQLSRTLHFADGSQVILGCLLPVTEAIGEYEIVADADSSERIEFSYGECDVRMEGSDSYQYYREGQGFVVSAGTKFFIKNDSLVQYIRRFQG